MREEQNRSKQQSNYILLSECKVRLATELDRWCQKRGGQVSGYIVTIPYQFERNLFLQDVDGYIVRIKKQKRELLLQIITTKEVSPRYGIKFEKSERIDHKDKMTIKNLSKSKGSWGK